MTAAEAISQFSRQHGKNPNNYDLNISEVDSADSKRNEIIESSQKKTEKLDEKAFDNLHAQFLEYMKPMHSIYKRCLIYIMRDFIAKKIGRSPVDGMWSFLEGISNSNSDLATLEMTQSIVLFIRDNARDGNKVAHGQDEIQIALAVTAVQEEGARSCWLHCFKMAFGSDATDWVE